MLLRGYDASTPVKPIGFDVTGLYIWGATPHIWTPQEIDLFSCPLKLPISVPMVFRNGQWTPLSDAQGTVDTLHALNVPEGSTVALDFETLINPSYVTQFDANMIANGYKTMIYGSTSTLFQNPKPSGGYWAATRPNNSDYPGDWQQYNHPGVMGTQLNDVGSYDIDVFDSSIAFWGSANTPTNWMDTIMNELPTLRQGSIGPEVRTLQGLLCARSFTVTVDGNFGPNTDSATRRFQVAYNIPNSVNSGIGDGIWGQHTWATAITGIRQ